MVEFLFVQKEILVNAKEKSVSATPLHLAVEKVNADVVKLLIEDNRVEVKALSNCGVSPLHREQKLL